MIQEISLSLSDKCWIISIQHDCVIMDASFHASASELTISLRTTSLLSQVLPYPSCHNFQLVTTNAIVGTVGAEKLSLFSAMLGDTYKDGGQVSECGSMTYSWIMNSTVRDSI